MNEYIILFLIVAGIVAYFGYVSYSKKKEAKEKLERYIQEKTKIRETIKEDKTERQPEEGKTPVVPPTKESEGKSETTITSFDDDSIEIRADGTWICPNDETINDGDACIICGQSRPGFVPQPVNSEGERKVATIVSRAIVTEQAPPKKGFTVAYKLNTSHDIIATDTAKPKPTSIIISADENLLVYDDG